MLATVKKFKYYDLVFKLNLNILTWLFLFCFVYGDVKMFVHLLINYIYFKAAD